MSSYILCVVLSKSINGVYYSFKSLRLLKLTLSEFSKSLLHKAFENSDGF